MDPPLGAPMMGYGARTGRAEGRNDSLYARALFVAGDESHAQVLWVQLDLCLLAPSQALDVRRRVAERTGVALECVLVACTHTHSGPETGLAQILAGVDPPEWVEPLLGAAVDAAVRSHAAAEPARLGVGRGEVQIGRNRRRAGGSHDPSLVVVRVDAVGGGAAPLAVLYLHGCHPTVLGHDNLVYSADWPGSASRTIEEALPGTFALFGLSAHADVDPRTRGVMDLAVDGQSVGVGFDQVGELGREVGAAVVEVASRIETRGDAAVGAASVTRPLAVHGAGAGPEAAREALAAGRKDALAALDLPADSGVGTGELFRVATERTRDFPPEERRARRARVRRYLRDRTAARFAGGTHPEVEAQVLRLGDALILALPLEATVGVGLAWRERIGSPYACVLSIANGWLRYLPHPDEFDEPGGERAYEVLMSTFEPEAARRLLSSGVQLAAELPAPAAGGSR
jgi:hypothetical protein